MNKILGVTERTIISRADDAVGDCRYLLTHPIAASIFAGMYTTGPHYNEGLISGEILEIAEELIIEGMLQNE